jgi:NADH:ubiquinone oxidoreductase subunit E
MVEICICIGSSCHLKGSYQIVKTFEELIKINKLEAVVELKGSFCLGRCTKGVAVKVGDDFIEDLTVANAIDKFEEYVLRRL